MDNAHIDVTSEGNETLAKTLDLAFGKFHKAIGYAIRAAVPSEKHPAEVMADPKNAYMLKPKRAAKPLRLVFFWTAPTAKDFVALPFKLDAKGAADFAARWLAEADYGKQPDHDGDNEKGWRVYNEAWGHVDDEYAGFVAVTPSWAMYGK